MGHQPRSSALRDHSKKKTFHDPQRERPSWKERVVNDWIELTQSSQRERLFLDESGAVCNRSLTFGYAPRGARAQGLKPTAKGTRVSTIGVLGRRGLLTSMCFEGTLKGQVFTDFVRERLLPHLSPNSLLILDNASPHRNTQALQLIAATGAKVRPLPPDSPEMNPIEYCWAEAKPLLRQQAPRTRSQLYDSWGRALETITPTLAQNCFQHCGFV